MTKSKLYRNLKPGDQFVVVDATNPPILRKATVTVSAVQETSRGYFTGRRQWLISGNYPWWWPTPIHAYSDERVDIIKKAR